MHHTLLTTFRNLRIGGYVSKRNRPLWKGPGRRSSIAGEGELPPDLALVSRPKRDDVAAVTASELHGELIRIEHLRRDGPVLTDLREIVVELRADHSSLASNSRHEGSGVEPEDVIPLELRFVSHAGRRLRTQIEASRVDEVLHGTSPGKGSSGLQYAFILGHFQPA